MAHQRRALILIHASRAAVSGEEMFLWDDRWDEWVGSEEADESKYLSSCNDEMEKVIRRKDKSQKPFQLNDDIYLSNRKTESVNYKNRGLCKCRLAY